MAIRIDPHQKKNIFVLTIVRQPGARRHGFQQNICFLKNYQRFLNFVKFTFSPNSWGVFWHFSKFSFTSEKLVIPTCVKKKIGRLAPCLGQTATPCGAIRRPIFFTWTYIGITEFLDVKNNFLNVPQEFGENVNFTKFKNLR